MPHLPIERELPLRRHVRVRTWRKWITEKEACSVPVQDQALSAIPRKLLLPVWKSMPVYPFNHAKRATEKARRRTKRKRKINLRPEAVPDTPPDSERQRRMLETETHQLPKPIFEWVQSHLQRRRHQTLSLRSHHFRASRTTTRIRLKSTRTAKGSTRKRVRYSRSSTSS